MGRRSLTSLCRVVSDAGSQHTVERVLCHRYHILSPLKGPGPIPPSTASLCWRKSVPALNRPAPLGPPGGRAAGPVAERRRGPGRLAPPSRGAGAAVPRGERRRRTGPRLPARAAIPPCAAMEVRRGAPRGEPSGGQRATSRAGCAQTRLRNHDSSVWPCRDCAVTVILPRTSAAAARARGACLEVRARGACARCRRPIFFVAKKKN